MVALHVPSPGCAKHATLQLTPEGFVESEFSARLVGWCTVMLNDRAVALCKLTVYVTLTTVSPVLALWFAAVALTVAPPVALRVTLFVLTLQE